MAEIGIVASIIQIAGAGVHLTMELYAFGSAFAGAKEDTDDIALGVSLYCMTLKQLAEKLQQKNSVQSPQALQGITDIREKSEQVFARIAAILPRSAGRPDTMTLVQRFKWNFKKARVNLLLGQLESLKLTLLLLVQIFAIGEEAQKSRFESVKPQCSSPLDPSRPDENIDESDIAVQTEMVHAIVLNKQRHQAVDHLADLQAAAEQEDKIAINAAPSDPPEGFVPVGDVSSALVKYNDQALMRVDRIMSAPERVDEMALILYMIDQWTIVRYVHDGSTPPPTRFESTTSGERMPNAPHVRAGNTSRSMPMPDRRSTGGNTGRYKSAYVEDDFSDAEDTAQRRQSPAGKQDNSTRVEEISDEDQSFVSPRPLRRAATTGTDVELSRQQLSAQRRKTIAADVTSILKKSNHNKLGITWRRGNEYAWREFTNQKLKSFDVKGVVLNVNKTHFRGDDTWTEFKKTDKVTVTASALRSQGYRFYEYQRYSHSYYESYDENGVGVGDPVRVYHPVIRVELPLVYSEIESLVRSRSDRGYIDEIYGSLDLNYDGASRKSKSSKPESRRNFDLSSDLPYPDAPMGNLGHSIGVVGRDLNKLFNKGNKLFTLGNTIASASNLNTKGDIAWKALEVIADHSIGGKSKSILDHILDGNSRSLGGEVSERDEKSRKSRAIMPEAERGRARRRSDIE